jgi:hypothetical protein
MTQQAVTLVAARLSSEEGRKPFAYNDKTGKRVTCKTSDPTTTGNLTIAEGINLEDGLFPEEMDYLTLNRLHKMDVSLSVYQWYLNANPARQSVFLDVAYNQGKEGLLHYPHMLAAALSNDWDTAAENLTDRDPSIDKSRYAPLRAILSSGVIA